jgi:hypothetical protein
VQKKNLAKKKPEKKCLRLLDDLAGLPGWVTWLGYLAGLIWLGYLAGLPGWVDLAGLPGWVIWLGYLAGLSG